MLNVTVIPQLSDNYVFLLQCSETGEAAIVDCPDAADMIARCEELGVVPSKILNTHHHPDHVAGNEELKKKWPELKIFGYEGDKSRIPEITDTLEIGGQVSVGNSTATVMLTEGHTLGHITYHFAEDKMVFCGDSMFVVGCGYLFEGTPAQMHEGLQQLGALDPETKVYCAHEYTTSNIAFALSIDPDNEALQQRQKDVAEARANDVPTIPSTVAQEWQTNPFLRVNDPVIRAAAEAAGADVSVPSEIFGAIRELKNNFKG